ncbi:hypothetical protein FDP41_003811 [Naegleria fowleri]|uniref:Uncharacterized protein n=1 Tax=Naegleria fowleri TaxID=5763 RepID=A0A6A5BT10_NAEFO|nr:uncharacterized protein FDP41_003811 [Naegleria fowleri]KAF0977158.1 hypothetical protein FDP41_003811 [Naegleria fowleri]
MPSTYEELFLPKAHDSNEHEMDLSIGNISDHSTQFTLFDIGLIKLAEEVASFVLAHGKAKSTKVLFKLFQSIQNKSDQEQLASTFIQLQQQTKHEMSTSNTSNGTTPSKEVSANSVSPVVSLQNIKKKQQSSVNKRKQPSTSSSSSRSDDESDPNEDGTGSFEEEEEESATPSKKQKKSRQKKEKSKKSSRRGDKRSVIEDASEDESMEGDEDGKKRRASGGKRAPPQKTNEDKEKYWSTHFQTMFSKSLPENFTTEQFKQSLSEKNSEPAFVTYGFLTKSQTESVKKSTFKFFKTYPRLFYLMSYTPLIQYGAAVASEWLESHPAYKAQFMNLPTQYLTIDKLFPGLADKYLD